MRPPFSAELAERWWSLFRSDVTGDEIGLRKGDEEFACLGVFKREKFSFNAEVVDVFFHAEVAANAAMVVDD